MYDKYNQIDKCIQKWLNDNSYIAKPLEIIAPILVDKGYYDDTKQCCNDIESLPQGELKHLLNANIKGNKILFVQRGIK